MPKKIKVEKSFEFDESPFDEIPEPVSTLEETPALATLEERLYPSREQLGHAGLATLEEHPGLATIARKALSADDTHPEVLWEKRLWANVKPVYMCKKCGEFRDSPDEIITHIVDHYPSDEQYKILDQLINELKE